MHKNELTIRVCNATRRLGAGVVSLAKTLGKSREKQSLFSSHNFEITFIYMCYREWEYKEA